VYNFSYYIQCIYPGSLKITREEINNLGININGKKIDICTDDIAIIADSNKDQAKLLKTTNKTLKKLFNMKINVRK